MASIPIPPTDAEGTQEDHLGATPMNELERQRLSFLIAGPCVPVEYINAYYGLPWPFPDDLSQDFGAWQTQRRRRVNCHDGHVSRYDLETFMQQKDVMPKKWMGARLGMTVASLDGLLSRLPDLQMRPQRYVVYADLIADALYNDLAPNLPGLRFRVFSDHNSFCMRLHADLHKVLGIDVQRLFCSTSARMGDYPGQIASDFDCITLEPLSGKHQVWLDFRKPINLRPDRCSKLFYAENREVLRTYSFGQRDPEDLEAYLHFLAEQ
jgi:hypothetical protein